ncbi:translation elongation factor 4 [Candidatus Riesia pediculicola]|uniref:Elongation factor 4 n=1 Tax=Riesia pediculicola (strain USDA) TaxID=515618 RepID=D4G8B5_RIEPU|nr:translation elongation factor 4 [Candidatus Riesia pediculicola]ADD79725.1 GTP-binding protein LepA [Candidatus Riesia pediculicola USDA]ARC53809.1 elongation factor 4 [Candidatus Riesia pediculicola]QOJ86442.1 elongation factor 4 [Candidatus Riesia pediculicola]
MLNQTKYIRNFSIIAHIDHGKSTLSDRIIQICNGVSEKFLRKNRERFLDSMDLEKEKGITIKSQNITLRYTSNNGNQYQLNLIDTPGHMDFIYEVLHSLSACEGALLVVDAKKGIQAQTLNTLNHALKMGLTIIPIINKIDLIDINLSSIVQNLSKISGIEKSRFLFCSAKTGYGIKKIIENIIQNIPSPTGGEKDPLQALIIDSWFDQYLGVIFLIKVKTGKILKGDQIKILGIKKSHLVRSIGIFNPNRTESKKLISGEIGWISCKIKNINEKLVGRMIFHSSHLKVSESSSNLESKKIQSQIYSNLFPKDPGSYSLLKDALIKLRLNDFSLCFSEECSDFFGNGFNCGFLGLFHLEITKERLIREYKIEVISTFPRLTYEIELKSKEILHLKDPEKISNFKGIREIREPISQCKILVPKEYIGKIIDLCSKKRGVQTDSLYLDDQVLLTYEVPTYEVISNFFDLLKSVSKGYASLEHHFIRFKKEKIVCVNILINGKKIDCLSSMIHQKKSKKHAEKIIKIITESFPRQQFNVIIQAAIGKIIVSRSEIKPFRKNVLSRCHGGDSSRKMKLLGKQKKGKKKMKKFARWTLSRSILLSLKKMYDA